MLKIILSAARDASIFKRIPRADEISSRFRMRQYADPDRFCYGIAWVYGSYFLVDKGPDG